ncbi:MAG: flagellar basal body P-ring protein FlgI, partial [Bryobacteraceae bacterium]|nr:flagellar basal body P-ring protein FlgI [Bryobacteraceae bacterium]
MFSKILVVALFFCFVTSGFADVPAARLKELASIEGVRGNQLLGYGIVVGLNGTGDRRQTVFSAQSLANLLNQMGVSVPAETLRVNNTAAVLVTASLPPFARPGAKIDVTAATIGDSSNLQGGLLILTSLKGVDGQTYAVAQGPVVTAGFTAGGGFGNRQTVNHPTVGRVPDGAIVERAAPSASLETSVRLQLAHADFTTASRVAEAVNKRFSSDGSIVARAENSASVVVDTPKSWAGRGADFIAELERLTVQADRVAKIVINERTGT